MYKYPEEAKKRFIEIDAYRYQDFAKATEEYQKMLCEFSEEGGVLARVYYYLAEIASLMTEFEACENYCNLGIQCGKESGNTRTQIMCILKLANIKIADHSEAMSADYLYEALTLIEATGENDLYDMVYILLGQLFDTAEDYEAAAYYYGLGTEAFVEKTPGAKDKYAAFYGARVLSSAACYMELRQVEKLEAAYQELVAVNFATSLPIGTGVMKALEGYLAYLKGEKESAGALMQQVVEEFAGCEEVLDTYNIFNKVYDVFESYGMVEDQKRVLDLMEHYNRKVTSQMCSQLCIDLRIRYYKQQGDHEALLKAYEAYYEAEKTYHNNSARQKQEYIKLRKRLFEEAKESKKKLEELKELSTIDAVTGLENRHALFAYTNQTFAEAVEKQQTFGVLLLDVDRFKEFNDTYGHVEGDKCLQQVAEIFKTVLQGQFCARYGGDEFICVFSGMSKEQVGALCEEIHKQVKALWIPHKKNIPYGMVTVSLGASIRIPSEQDDFVLFLQEADEKLYQCKENGRSRTEICQ